MPKPNDLFSTIPILQISKGVYLKLIIDITKYINGPSCNLGPRKLKKVHVTISCLDGHPRKFIHEKLQNDQTLKILYLENFHI